MDGAPRKLDIMVDSEVPSSVFPRASRRYDIVASGAQPVSYKKKKRKVRSCLLLGFCLACLFLSHFAVAVRVACLQCLLCLLCLGGTGDERGTTCKRCSNPEQARHSKHSYVAKCRVLQSGCRGSGSTGTERRSITQHSDQREA